MAFLLHQLIFDSAARRPDAVALLHRNETLDYRTLADGVNRIAAGLRRLGVERDQRVAVFLPKQFEAVVALFAVAAAGGIFVPVNPVLKAAQVGHILRNCGATILITSADRARMLSDEMAATPSLTHLVLVGDSSSSFDGDVPAQPIAWQELAHDAAAPTLSRIDSDIAAILYTSGSTGKPKGVVLTHRNLLAGAQSVASYLHNSEQDRLLAVLPLSFDYGLSQLTTAFAVGGSVVLLDYLLPKDVLRAVERYAVTGLAAVPPLWNQLAALSWPENAVEHLRYLTNSGGALPIATTQALQRALPNSEIYLMYGLTEAFRSTYLAPDQVSLRPTSMGKAIPNAEVLVLRPDGSECAAEEVGELVHRGTLVARGYWADPHGTASRFRPLSTVADDPSPELAVWSGDRVRRDAEGFLYFVSRDDEMIKTSGYRVSPSEIEEAVFALPGVEQVAALGAPHPQLGQAVVLLVQVADGRTDVETIAAHCRRQLPAFMLPAHIALRTELPRNPNGKVDRNRLSQEYAQIFSATDSTP